MFEVFDPEVKIWEMVQPFYIREVKKRNGVIEVHLEDLYSLNIPELREEVLWDVLRKLRGIGVVPISFQILRFDIRNTTLYNVAKFMASNYERIRPIYKAIKSSLNSRPVVAEIPGDVDVSLAESFVNRLIQLSSAGILNGVEFYKESRIIRIESMPDSYFLTGGWLELALADAITSLCPFREFVLMKNLKFRFKNVNNEADILLLSDRGNFLFETKTTLRVSDLESLCYKLLRIGNILRIAPERIFLVVPSMEDLIDEGKQMDASEDGEISGCPGINIMTLDNIKGILTKRFYDILISGDTTEY